MGDHTTMPALTPSVPPVPDRALDHLPVMCLPSQVVLPGSRVPLRVNAPARRSLLRDGAALEHGFWLVLAQGERMVCQTPEGERLARRCRAVGALGRVLRLRRHDSTRLDVEVAVVARVRLSALPLDDALRHSHTRGRLLRERNAGGVPELPALLSLAAQIGHTLHGLQPEFSLTLPRREAGAGKVVDAVADQLVRDPLRRQRVLEALDVRARVALVLEDLCRLHLALRPPHDAGGRLH